MTGRESLAFFLVVLCLCTYSHAQNWSGIIDPSRVVDWSNTSPGVVGGIPTNTTQCGSTISPYSGTAGTINNAIAACGANQYVLLGPGMFNLSSGIDFAGHSNVTLRGSGPSGTFLVFSGDVSCGGLGADICVKDARGYGPGSILPANQTANWTAGYSRGANVITLDNVNLLRAGTIISLDQLDDSSDGGAVYSCQAQNVCGSDVPAGSGRKGRIQNQIVTVVSVNGNNVTITPGLYMSNWRSGQSPGAWWAGAAPVSRDGIENLSVDHTASTSGLSGIYFVNAANCWVKNVRSIRGNRNHVWLYQQTAHITVRDSYFYGTQKAASQSYGVEGFGAGDILIENNIFQQIAVPTVFSGVTGTVVGYNFMINDLYSSPSTWQQAGLYDHAAGTEMNLREGNQSSGFTADAVHGTHYMETLFRNYLTGKESGRTMQTSPIIMNTHSRFFNIIGNVLGTNAFHTQYQDCYGGSPCITKTDGKADVSVYTLGWCGNEGTNIQGSNGCGSSMLSDATTASTLLRWGNYDTVNAAVRWVSDEVPSALGSYSSAVPGNHALPASFYLSSKPAWWGTMPWPAIGPDVTGGNEANVGGHVYIIPAHTCYTNVMSGPADGSGGPLSFNADSCYSSASEGAPAPPSNLTAIVH